MKKVGKIRFMGPAECNDKHIPAYSEEILDTLGKTLFVIGELRGVKTGSIFHMNIDSLVCICSRDYKMPIFDR